MPEVQKWRVAAEKYRQQRQIEQALACKPGSPEFEAAVTENTRIFENFLDSSHGQAILYLLKASGRRIVLIGHDGKGPYGKVYLLDGEGLKCLFRPVGLWVVNARLKTMIKPTTLTSATPMEVIRVGQHRLVSAGNLVQLIISTANQIADSAPSSKD